jgi:hypothetical protein
MLLGVGPYKRRASLINILVAVVLLLPAAAAAQPEAAGAKDFPLIKRYEGSRLIARQPGVRSNCCSTAQGRRQGQTGSGCREGGRGPPHGAALSRTAGRNLKVFRNHETDLAATVL